MCVIIKVEPKKTLPKELLKNCYDNNPDGYGMMIAENDGLFFHKDVKDFDDFWKMWRSFDRDKPRAIHFRRKTHGLLNQENCHPFFPEGGHVGFMHNGVINVPETHKDMNDTYNFMKLKIEPWITRFPEIVEEDFFYKMLEEQTSSSKLLFLTRSGNYHLTNLSMWHTAHGCMFSNKHSLDRRTSVASTTNYNRNNSHSHSNCNTQYANGRTNYSHNRDDHDWEDDYGWGYGDPLPTDDTRPYGMGHNSQNTEADVGPVTKPHYGNIDRWEDMLKAAQEQLDAADSLDPDTEAALRDCETALAQIMVRKNNSIIIDGECSVVTEETEPVAEGSFEEAGRTLVNRVEEEKGLPEVDEQPVGVVVDVEDGQEETDIFDVFKTPEDIRNMTDDEIEDWAEECPFGAAQAIMMLTGRV